VRLREDFLPRMEPAVPSRTKKILGEDPTHRTGGSQRKGTEEIETKY